MNSYNSSYPKLTMRNIYHALGRIYKHYVWQVAAVILKGTILHGH